MVNGLERAGPRGMSASGSPAGSRPHPERKGGCRASRLWRARRQREDRHDRRSTRGSRRRRAPPTRTCTSTTSPSATRSRRPRRSCRRRRGSTTTARCSGASASSAWSWCSRPPTAPTTAAPWMRWRRSAMRRARSWWSIRRVERRRAGAPHGGGRARHPLPHAQGRRAALGHPGGDGGAGARRSAGTCSCSATAASCPSAKRCCKRLPGDLVIDHVGRFMDPVPLDHPAFACLLGLLETRAHLGQAVRALRELARRTARVRGRERARPGAGARRARAHAVGLATGRTPATATHACATTPLLLDLLIEWAPEEAMRRRILVDNPAALYGF